MNLDTDFFFNTSTAAQNELFKYLYLSCQQKPRRLTYSDIKVEDDQKPTLPLKFSPLVTSHPVVPARRCLCGGGRDLKENSSVFQSKGVKLHKIQVLKTCLYPRIFTFVCKYHPNNQ